MQKLNWKTKASLMLSIVAFAVAIYNFWGGSERARVIIWGILVIIWGILVIIWALNYLVVLEDNVRYIKERNKAVLKTQFWRNAVSGIENEVRFNVYLSDEAREQLLEKISEEVEDIKAQCEMFEIE